LVLENVDGMSGYYHYKRADYLRQEFQERVGIKGVIGQAHYKCYGAANEYAQHFNVEAHGFVGKQDGDNECKQKDHVKRNASECGLGVRAPSYFMSFFSPDAKRLNKFKQDVIDDKRKKKAKEKERSEYEGII
jgi:hypothetical protein